MEEEYLTAHDPLPIFDRDYAVRVDVSTEAFSENADVHVRVVVRHAEGRSPDVGVLCGVHDSMSGESRECAALVRGVAR